jgi:hypothetical protein
MNTNANLNEKEVVMEVKEGGAKTRRRRRKGVPSTGAVEATMVTKAEAVPKPVVPTPAATGVVSSVKKPVVVIAPPKKKVPKVMLVPKSKSVPTVNLKKTFRAKRIAVTINNTAKTQKQHRGIVEDVDAMTDDQVRAAACSAKLSRRETVGKAPITLLRQMIKDYQLMKKMLN